MVYFGHCACICAALLCPRRPFRAHCRNTRWIETMADLEQSAEQVFGEALDLQPEHRSAFLEEACRGAPDLRHLVEDLLRKNQQVGSFLAGPLYPAVDKSSQATQAPAASQGLVTGTKLGRYTIIEALGAGGMGVVYRARATKSWSGRSRSRFCRAVYSRVMRRAAAFTRKRSRLPN